MAEGLLGGLLQDDDDEPPTARAEARHYRRGRGIRHAAVAARLSGNDPGVARKTEEFLDKQSQLLEIQAKHLVDEHPLRLDHLGYQSQLLRGQRLGQSFRIGFQVFIALTATVIGLGVALMLHDAITSRSVVVDAFDAPAALADRGLTGKVVASGVLDELNRLQSATRTTAVKRELSTAWSSEVKLAVPETGISIGEISRVLKARFGHDLHINGDLVQTDAGALALTVRGDGIHRRLSQAPKRASASSRPTPPNTFTRARSLRPGLITCRTHSAMKKRSPSAATGSRSAD